MFSKVFDEIRSAYSNEIVYPPILVAGISSSNYPCVCFFVKYSGNVDAVIVDSVAASIKGVMKVKSFPVSEPVAIQSMDSYDEEFTTICEKISNKDMSLCDDYPVYLQKTYKGEDILAVASLCPFALSPDFMLTFNDDPDKVLEKVQSYATKYIFEEKNMPKNIETETKWMNDVQGLPAYRKAILAGKGDLLFHVIRFVNAKHSGDFDSCAEKFAEFLFTAQLVDKPKPQPANTGGRCVYVNCKPGNQKGCYWILDEEHFQNIGNDIKFDISGVNLAGLGLAKVIEKTGLAFDEDELNAAAAKYPDWAFIDEKLFINNTLLSHYASHDDDRFHLSDLNWLDGYEKPVREERLHNTEKPVNVQPAPVKPKPSDKIPALNAVPNKPTDISEPPKKPDVQPERPVVTEEIIIDDVDTPSPEAMQQPDETQVAQQVVPEPVSNDNDIPAPQNDELNEDIEEDSEDVIREKMEFNKALSSGIRQVYEETITFLRKQHDVRWQGFVDEYRAAVENDDFSVLACRRFLEMTSNDVKSQVYATLYKADKATGAYQKEVKRIMKSALCFGCHKTFTEDVTFAKDFNHVATCPHCGNSVRMPLNWLA